MRDGGWKGEVRFCTRATRIRMAGASNLEWGESNSGIATPLSWAFDVHTHIVFRTGTLLNNPEFVVYKDSMIH